MNFNIKQLQTDKIGWLIQFFSPESFYLSCKIKRIKNCKTNIFSLTIRMDETFTYTPINSSELANLSDISNKIRINSILTTTAAKSG